LQIFSNQNFMQILTHKLHEHNQNLYLLVHSNVDPLQFLTFQKQRNFNEIT
jgi:hypothetical protein